MSDENHAKFLSHLGNSNAGVFVVAEWLHGQGFPVSVPVSRKVEKHDDWKDGADGGDLFIQRRVEVKQLTADFTSPEDWPFRPKFIVCAKHAFDRAVPKPWMFVILNKAGTHVAVVNSSSHCRWHVESRADKRYDNVIQEFYFADMADVSFKSLR